MNYSTETLLENINKLPPKEAISSLDQFISANPENDAALTLRGMKHWALNHRDKAINDFLAAIKINPEGKGKTALQYVNSILDFYNHDLLNP